MFNGIYRMWVMGALIAPFGCQAHYVAELTIHVNQNYQGNLVMGLQEHRLLKQVGDTELWLISDSSVQDNVATLRYTFMERQISLPENHNQLTLPILTTPINEFASVSLNHDVFYRARVTATDLPSESE